MTTKTDKIVKLIELQGGKQMAWSGCYNTLLSVPGPYEPKAFATALIEVLWTSMLQKQVEANDKVYSEKEIDLLLKLYENETVRGLLLRGLNVVQNATSGLMELVNDHIDEIVRLYDRLNDNDPD
jgi:hypothetical protein